MNDTIAALEAVSKEIREEYTRNQNSRWFSSEYAEGLSVAQPHREHQNQRAEKCRYTVKPSYV